MRALMLLANGFQDQEAIYPYYRLQEAGYDAHVFTMDGKAARGIIGIEMPYSLPYWVPVLDHDLLVIPGGVKAMEKLRLLEGAVDLVRNYYAAGKVIASICSGAQMLISAGLCKGKAISAYPAMRVDVENAGAEFRNAVTADQRIVTAPHYRDLGAWMAMVFWVMNETRAN